MQRNVPPLLIATRVLAILAVLAGLAAGLLLNVVATLVCIDSCPLARNFPSHLDLNSVGLLIPCLALATLALAFFLAYCLAVRQGWRALIVLLVSLVGGLIGAAALDALLQYGNATSEVTESGFLVGGPARAWTRQWALATLFAAVVWSGCLACLEWGRRWRRLGQPI
jgi:hypothetical protein